MSQLYLNKTISRLQTFHKFRELFIQLVARDIKLKYRRSILGYFWSVLNPLLVMIVMIIVFSNLFARGIPNFPIYLLIGQMLFNFMAIATSRAIPSITGNASIIKKIYVPKYIFTLSVVTSEFITFLLGLGALLIVIFATKAPISWRFVFTIIPIIELYAFCIGMSLFLAQATVFFRDIVYIWNVLTTAWLYLSAIFYPVEILPDWLLRLVTGYNPMYFYITMFRNFTLGGPNMGSLNLAIRGAFAAGIILFIGLICFTLSKNKFILYI